MVGAALSGGPGPAGSHRFRLAGRHLPLDETRAGQLAPVDLAQSPVGELLLAERERRLARYGRATQMIDLTSPANNAFSLRGTEFYPELFITVAQGL